MKRLNTLLSLRAKALAIFTALTLAACGGSSGGDSQPAPQPQPSTGTIGIVFTDAPSDIFSAIRLNVVQATLIGGDDSQEVLFTGSEPIDLLDLTNYSEPIVFGEVKAGTYKKLRLNIDDLELVPKDGSPSIFPALPANGKIDLLQASGFDVLPGRTLMIEIDMDANKSIKITGAGNSGRYNFRPVVKVRIFDGGLPHKLARLEGSVSQIFDDPAGSFELCDIDSPDHCIPVNTDANTSLFDDEGLGTDFASLMEGDMVVAIGQYETDPGIALNALVVEIGGNAEQIKGSVVSDPQDSQFLVITVDGVDLTVELQPGTKYFDANGPIGEEAIVLGADVEVEGVMPPKVDPADPDLIRAALVFLEGPDAEQISGTIIEPLDAATRSFGLT
ncbi:MAG: DUF4382 domain-containing protein, partial [Woeseiaceae bacterium]|nr:DUF4382 domain-containing protein [Woeseiaceae bacterium]